MGLWDRLSRRLDELSEELLPDDLRGTVDGARELIRRGEHTAAIAALDRVLSAKPDHATALYLLGLAELRLGHPDTARAAFERASSARAGFTEALIGLAEARLTAGDANGAIPLVREALISGGARDVLADAYRVLGRAYLAIGETDKGLRELRKALAEDPLDAEAAVALAQELLASPELDPEEARGALERLVATEDPSAEALAAYGRLELAAGRLDPAEKALRRALATPILHAVPRAAAMVALADLLMKRGDTLGAHEQLLRALAVTPKDPTLHERLARLHLAAANLDAALDAFDHAAAVGGWQPWPALDAALDAERIDRAIGYARALAPSDDPRVRALLAAASGDRNGARLALAAARPDRGVALLQARLDAEAGEPSQAAEQLLALLKQNPNDAVVRRFYDEVTRIPFDASGDMYALATRFHAWSLAHHSTLAPEAARIVESYDRPLLVTVMGEFSSGKSTFVNAFLGANIAPVGITPTTATINILKYGREQGARVLYRDDRVRELTWNEVPRVLRAVDSEEARRIAHVEVLYPLEALQRVNIVDTPGLNSILPEHEATARAFIAQADAVIWLFSAGQAGKASEREALERIRAEGRRVLGVVNKIDQVGDEAPRILAHLHDELGGLVEALVPVSARRALAARQAGDAAALTAAAWPALETALEEHFFAQARALKRDACAQRLGGLVARARTEIIARQSRASERAAVLRQAANAARADAALFTRITVPEERRAVAERMATTYRAAARDVLELVRPRKTPFGTNSASTADRDYLVGFLDRALAEAIRPTRQRVLADLNTSGTQAERAAADAAEVIGPGAADDLRAHVADARALLEARVFDGARAYLRGFLRGGAIDAFFARTLAKLELDEDSVYHALVRDAPDLDHELVTPLATQGEAALRGLGQRLDALAATATVAELAAGTLAQALDAFDNERRRLTP